MDYQRLSMGSEPRPPYLLYLGLGSNLGQREKNLEEMAVSFHRSFAESVLLKASSVYESEPWGFACDTPFLNQVLIFDMGACPPQPSEVLNRIAEVEHSLGRVRPSDVRYAPRTADIDILCYNGYVLHTPELTIPHPQIPNRRFVLDPLVEIDPEGRHPMLGLTWKELLASCPDTGWVRLYAANRLGTLGA